ncbi:hypothetical protein BIU87_30920 [Streptomyces sp. ZS0098]|nr:hypothetical protein BIU87_30920 [Streptomyces sp. ZS0098]
MQAGLADRFRQQHGPGLRDRPTTAALDADTQVALDALPHLGSASSGWRRDRIGSALRGENLVLDPSVQRLSELPMSRRRAFIEQQIAGFATDGATGCLADAGA